MMIKMKRTVAVLIVTISLFVSSSNLHAQDATSAADGLLDESLQDLTVVFGTGAVGAILGLSTLSFADEPKDHLKNVSIGGAIGVVIGVGIVVFGQASRSQNSISHRPTSPLGADSVEKLARIAFSKQKIAENYFLTPTVGYNFSF